MLQRTSRSRFVREGAGIWKLGYLIPRFCCYTIPDYFVRFIPCYPSRNSPYDVRLLNRMDEKSMAQQQDGQTSLTSGIVSPSVAADPLDYQSIQDGSQGQREQKPQLKDYFVCSPLPISIRPYLTMFSVFLAMQPRLTFLPTLWVSLRPSRRELLYH